MDPIQWLMQMMQGGGASPPSGAGIPQATDAFPGAGSRMPGAVPPYTPQAGGVAPPPPPQPVPTPAGPLSATLAGGGGTGAFPGMAGGADQMVPGQVPGQGPRPASTPSPINPQTMAALQAIQAPESENRGPPAPPGAPAGPKAIDPGLLFEALLKLGVHPGQIPSLTKSLGG